MSTYDECGRILASHRRGEGSIKTLVYRSKSGVDQRQLLALCAETQRRREILVAALQSVPDAREAAALASGSSWKGDAVLVGVYELAYSQRGLKCGGWLKAMLNSHRAALRAAVREGEARAKTNGASDGASTANSSAVDASDEARRPRYVRVNTLRTTVPLAIEAFKTEGFTFVSDAPDDPHALAPRCFYADTLLDDLLVFTTGTDLHGSALYQSGAVVQQDKASCLPAHVLAPPPGSVAMDVCAAPGNKTTHLAARMAGRGRVFAFDRDPERAKILSAQVSRTGSDRVVRVTCGDFLAVNPNDAEYKEVAYVLADPSCSGSGIGHGDVPPSRLRALASFQRKIITHAMRFPNATRLSYSTCSVHDEENELVVEAVLAAHPHWRLCDALPSWPHRGHRGLTQCLRASPAHDATHGFFVALFERHQPMPLHPQPSLSTQAPRKPHGKRPRQEDTRPQKDETKTMTKRRKKGPVTKR